VFARIREDVKRDRNIRMFRGANTKAPSLDDIHPVDGKKGAKKMPLSTCEAINQPPTLPPFLL
jgi:hypothetical protein